MSLKTKMTNIIRVASGKQLAGLLLTPEHIIELLAARPPYDVFSISKGGSKTRLIESPREPLKSILSELNGYLQAAYYYNRTDAAYGYVINRKKDPDIRNIVANAKVHVGNPWMINMDLKDFFHHIRKVRIKDIFMTAPFKFNDDVAEMVAGLTTYKDRLPMGSPTSPALSNFATRDLDIEFLQWGRRNNIRYTRFVDDCTFSSQSELEELHISQAENIFKSHGFMVNPDKTRLYEKEDIKTVTGLELHNRPEIPDAFFTRLDDDILRLKHVIEVHTINFGTTLPDWIQQFEKSLRGKVNFTGMVYGLKSDLYNKYSAMLEDALLVNEEQLFAGWRDFDNYSF